VDRLDLFSPQKHRPSRGFYCQSETISRVFAAFGRRIDVHHFAANVRVRETEEIEQRVDVFHADAVASAGGLVRRKGFEQTNDGGFLQSAQRAQGELSATALARRSSCANKPGELEGVRNDSRIVSTGNRPYVISVMTTFLRHERDGGDVIVRISAAAYSLFDCLSRASEYGRIVPTHDSSPP
jgi:hypothetical protein